MAWSKITIGNFSKTLQDHKACFHKELQKIIHSSEAIGSTRHRATSLRAIPFQHKPSGQCQTCTVRVYVGILSTHFVSEALKPWRMTLYGAWRYKRDNMEQLCSIAQILSACEPQFAWLDGTSSAKFWASSLLSPSSGGGPELRAMAGVYRSEICEGAWGRCLEGVSGLGNIEQGFQHMNRARVGRRWEGKEVELSATVGHIFCYYFETQSLLEFPNEMCRMDLLGTASVFGPIRTSDTFIQQ